MKKTVTVCGKEVPLDRVYLYAQLRVDPVRHIPIAWWLARLRKPIIGVENIRSDSRWSLEVRSGGTAGSLPRNGR